MKELMADFQKRYEDAMASHERMVSESHAKYEQTLANATSQFRNMMAQIHTDTESEKKPEPEGEADSPQAVWIKAPSETGNGEDMLVLNQAAVVMFMAIFQRMSEISEELKKLGGRRTR